MTLNFLACVFCRKLVATDNFLPSKTTEDMIVDQTRGLHVRIAYRRADELEAALFQVFAKCV